MRAVTLAFTLGVLAGLPALAQVESNIATLRSEIQADRQAIVRFFQIEGKLDAIQRAYAALELPLVRR